MWSFNRSSTVPLLSYVTHTAHDEKRGHHTKTHSTTHRVVFSFFFILSSPDQIFKTSPNISKQFKYVKFQHILPTIPKYAFGSLLFIFRFVKRNEIFLKISKIDKTSMGGQIFNSRRLLADLSICRVLT